MPTNTQHITPSELKDMLPQKPERMNMVPEPRKSELVQATYGIIGCMQQVHNQLGPGLPEYIYQEALAIALTEANILQWGPQRKPNEVFAMGRAGSSEYFLPNNRLSFYEKRKRYMVHVSRIVPR